MINENFSKESPILIRRPDEMWEELDELNLDLDDKELALNISKRITKSEEFYQSEKIDLYNRRLRNKDFLQGKQLNVRNMKRYQVPYIDNLIYEAEAMLKPIAQSRLPDLMVKPAKDTVLSKKLAEDLTKVLNNDIRKRENRRVLGVAWKHLPVYFVGAIKAYWDPMDGPKGNYKFKNVHPENIVLDHTCPTNNPEDMKFIAEKVELTIKDLCVRFPKKEKEIYAKLGVTDNNKSEIMASPVKIWEVWFKWWEKDNEKRTASPDTEQIAQWKEVEAVAWKYDDIILDRMKNPYWDWKGESKIMSPEGSVLPFEQLPNALLGDIPSEIGKFYRNYFDNPQKPYIFLNYDQWGEYPYDVTSRIEQTISIQENINKRAMQITDMNDQARGKHIFSTKSGLTKKDIEKLDLDNPHQDLVVNGDINEAHRFIQGTPAQPGLYNELNMDKERLFAKMGTNSTTRGERQGEETALGRQILRESDFGRIDDMVEDTINYAAERMAMWSMQFIKLFYTAEHIVKIVGETGNITFAQITKDSVEDGMEVVVAASGSDKLMAKREAYERARLGFTDPLTFFIDVQASDPKGRAEKLLTLQADPMLYLQKFVLGNTTEMMVQALENSPQAVTPTAEAPVATEPALAAPQAGVQPFANEPNPNLRRTPALFETPAESKSL